MHRDRSNVRARPKSSQLIWLACIVIAVAGCSASDPRGSGGSVAAAGARASGAAAENGGSATAAVGGRSTNDNPVGVIGNGGAAAALGGGAGKGSSTGNGGPACATTSQEAERVPVDIYIMLDRSGSMRDTTGAGPTKWDATRDALTMFLNDPRSNGLGVGLQFFPIGKAGVPTECTTDAQCSGDSGPCINRVCEPPRFSTSNTVTACLSNADCPLLSPGCVPAGTCASDDTLVCLTLGVDGCGRGDTCKPLVGECYGYASCEPTDYAKPEVAILALPANAPALTASLAAAMPQGLTPTFAALSGALQLATQQAHAQPSHRVIAVLATDGTPAGCPSDDVTSVGDVARAGAMGTPGITTYVVGVFGPMETAARTNLDAWAAAGGSSKAFIVDPTQDVAAQFLDALEKIRSGSIACEYLLPPNPTGSELDLGLVNVALVEGQTSRDFLYVGDEGRCGLAPLGWHYDVDPSSGKATKIVVCRAACDTLRSTDNGRVDVRLGCKTMGPD